MTHIFDTATALQSTGPNTWTGQANPAYGNLAGPFGGTTTATLLRSVLEDPAQSGQIVNQSVNFCGAIGPEPFEITTRLIRAGRYLQHWNVELTQADDIKATAHFVSATRAETFSHHAQSMPEVPAPEACTPLPEVSGFSAWLNRYEFRFCEGDAAFGGPRFKDLQSAKTSFWITDRPERALDALSLAAMSDAFFLRLLHVRGRLAPMGTVALTTHVIATEDEIAAQGTAPLLGTADAIRFHGNFHDQQMQLWGKNGNLLASGSQIVWFKE